MKATETPAPLSVAQRLLLFAERLQRDSAVPVADLDTLLAAQQILARFEAAAGKNPETLMCAPIVSPRGVARVDVTWLGKFVQVDAETARACATLLLENAAAAEIDVALVQWYVQAAGFSLTAAVQQLERFRMFREGGAVRPPVEAQEVADGGKGSH